MQKSSKIESVVPFVVGNLRCIKMFGENSFTSWVTRKITFDFLGWLVWISAHLVFISCVMILKKKDLKKSGLEIQASSLMLKLSKTQLTSLLWIVLKLVRLVWIFEVMRLPQSNIFSHWIVPIFEKNTIFKGPSINYVVSKSAIFDPLPPISRLFY